MVSLSLAFGTLFGWHVFLISKNMTTIEVNLEILKLINSMDISLVIEIV